MERISGIYKIRNKKTNKIYVGKSVNIEERWKQHKSELFFKKHHNVDLQEDYNKFGEDIFEYSVLELCEKDKLFDRERCWIDTFNAREFGYNYENRKTKIGERSGKKFKLMKKFVDKIKEVLVEETMCLINWESLCEFMGITEKSLLGLINTSNRKYAMEQNVYYELCPKCQNGEYLLTSIFDEESDLKDIIYIDRLK